MEWVFEIPYESGGRTEDGADCWGLVVLFYSKEFNINLPLHDWVSDDTNKDYAKNCHEAESLVREANLFQQVECPRYGDLVLLNIATRPIHIAVAINDTQMLHIGPKHNVVIEDFTEIKWNRRINSFHRHKLLM